MSGASSDLFTYLCAPTTATTRGNNQTQKHPIPLFLGTATLIFVFFSITEDRRGPTYSCQCCNTNAGRMRIPDNNVRKPRYCHCRRRRCRCWQMKIQWRKETRSRRGSWELLGGWRGSPSMRLAQKCVTVTEKLAVQIHGGEVERWRWGRLQAPGSSRAPARHFALLKLDLQNKIEYEKYNVI